jgi:hypothetical protein
MGPWVLISASWYKIAIPRRVFAIILTMINALRGPPSLGAPA